MFKWKIINQILHLIYFGDKRFNVEQTNLSEAEVKVEINQLKSLKKIIVVHTNVKPNTDIQCMVILAEKKKKLVLLEEPWAELEVLQLVSAAATAASKQ